MQLEAELLSDMGRVCDTVLMMKDKALDFYQRSIGIAMTCANHQHFVARAWYVTARKGVEERQNKVRVGHAYRVLEGPSQRVRYELESKSVHCCLGGWKVFGREN